MRSYTTITDVSSDYIVHSFLTEILVVTLCLQQISGIILGV
jgi:hypothetical protein